MREPGRNGSGPPRPASGRGRHGAAEGAKRRRTVAELPPWQADVEQFDGATVLRDLGAREDDVAAVKRILARYAVIRFALAVGRDEAGEDPRAERAAAAAYVEAASKPRSADRRALGGVLKAAAGGNGPSLWRALHGAGTRASRQGELSGARGCFRAGYDLAMIARDPAAAAAGADALGALAEEVGAPRSAQQWRQRAVQLRARPPLPPRRFDLADGSFAG